MDETTRPGEAGALSASDLRRLAHYWLARWHVREDLREDAAQEFALAAMVALVRSRDGMSPRAYMKAYGVGGMKTFLHREYKHQRRETIMRGPGDSEDEAPFPEIEDTAEAHDERIAGSDEAAWLRSMVDELPARMAAVVRLRYFERLTLEQTGRRMGFGKENARRIETMALDRLRRRVLERRAPKLRETEDQAR